MSCTIIYYYLFYIFFSFLFFLCVVFSPHVVFCIFWPHYGNGERADLTTEQPDELHFHGLSRLLVTSHCLFSFSVYLVKNCDNKKTTATTTTLSRNRCRRVYLDQKPTNLRTWAFPNLFLTTIVLTINQDQNYVTKAKNCPE